MTEALLIVSGVAIRFIGSLQAGMDKHRGESTADQREPEEQKGVWLYGQIAG